MKLTIFIILMLMYPLFLRLIHISDLRVIPLIAPYALGVLSIVVMISGIIEFISKKLREKQQEEVMSTNNNRSKDGHLSISNYHSSYYQRVAAVTTAIVLIIIVAVTFPYAQEPGTAVQPFLPAFIAAVVFCELITAYLMLSEFQVTRSPALLVLATAYLYTGLITIPHILTFPGVFSETGLLNAGTQTATWLWVFWHGGYPFLVTLYVVTEVKFGKIRLTLRQAKLGLGIALGTIVVLIAGLTLLAIAADQLLPKIIQKDNFNILITSGIGPVVWLLNFVALASLLWFARGRTVVQLWLTVAILASLLDVTLTLFSGSRYSVGWYVARLNSILSATLVLGTLLYEIRILYYRIVQQERIFRTIFEFAAVGIARIDLNQKPLEANEAFQQMLGRGEEELHAQSLTAITHPDDIKKDSRALNELLNGKRNNYQVEKRYIHKDGSMVWGNSIVSLVRGLEDEPEFFIGMVEDITKRKEYEERIRFQAYHDALTQLPNRMAFSEKLNAAALSAKQTNGKFAVLFIDLDGFKKVNDTLGHDAGDMLLQGVAARLLECVKPDDILARMGGDEFTMILPDLSVDRDANKTANMILMTLNQPFVLNGHEVSIGASIGISLYPIHGEDAQSLMKHADNAMYKAKESGKNQYVLYEQGE
ncbi:PAS domain S-box-containing protein/diguanylate cyclase (GGDEF) domain-containing protein [Paenibacillus sp. 1_12]|uniref:sensor domain-containing diguanylate cyclase n=1 Tax=Paenibacillus sp. 1_12 TaxID=1566278 RepID=UPI0008E1ACAD|nr:GGDEF domain-containing protein [Paenibacillus sp. 1_12]SFL10439.1 PAS domain S-box-containing protein/diguanylate cyclase (GGDEF) domain-containing protein [Paenibacillus sp. 1_12]